MTRRIYKYPINFGTGFPSDKGIELPRYSKVIHFGAQGRQLYVWAEVTVQDDGSTFELVPTNLMVYGTGWDIPMAARHEASCQIDGFVWHLYRTWP